MQQIRNPIEATPGPPPSPATAPATGTAEAPRRMSLGAMVAYGSGDFYGGGSFFVIGTLYVVFLTTVAGLSAWHAGAIVLAGKIWAAVANPVVGWLSDHTTCRYGRRRTYFLFGLVPAFAVLWLPVRFEHALGTFAWHLAAYLVFNTLFALVKIPYNSILTEMTSDYTERSRAMGIRMVFSQGGAFVGALLPLTIIAAWGGGGHGYLVMGLVFGVLYTIPWIFEFLYTWDRPVDTTRSAGSLAQELAGIFRCFGSTLRNRSFAIHMGMYLTAFMNLDIFNGIFVFFVTCSLGRDLGMARNLLTVIQGCQFVALPLVTILCYRCGNAVAYRVSLLVWGAGIVAFSLLPATASSTALFGTAVVIGLGLSGAVLTPWNIQTFVADVDEIMTTRRREGVYAGFMQFARQIAMGVGLFATNAVLEAMGFVKGSPLQPESVALGIRHYLTLAPLLMLGAGVAISTRFQVCPRNHRILLAEVERRKRGGRAEDVTPEARGVCERLTGQPYERLWDPSLAD